MRSLIYLEATKLTCQHFIAAGRRQKTPESDRGLLTASEKHHLAAVHRAVHLGQGPNIMC